MNWPKKFQRNKLTGWMVHHILPLFPISGGWIPLARKPWYGTSYFLLDIIGPSVAYFFLDWNYLLLRLFIIKMSLQIIIINGRGINFLWSTCLVFYILYESQYDCNIITINVTINKPATTYPEQDGTNLPSKNWWQWTNYTFFAAVSSPIPPLKYLSKTMSSNLTSKSTFGVNFIYP